jgi:hypothetical protein
MKCVKGGELLYLSDFGCRSLARSLLTLVSVSAVFSIA